MPSRAGKFCAVHVPGTPTAMTAEAVTVLTTNQIYQITNTARRVMDPTATQTVKAAGVAVNPVTDPYTLDRLRGIVTFVNVSARGTVTIDGTYLPMAIIAKAKAFSYSITRPVLYDTGFEDAGWQTHIAGQHFDVVGTLNRWFQITYALRDQIINDGLYVLSFYIRDLTTPEFLCWAKIRKFELQAALDSLIDEAVEFEGTGDAEKRVASQLTP